GLLTMPIETIDIIIDYLNARDLQNLSKSCRQLRRAARIFHFGVNSPIWKDITNDLIIAPPISNYRDGVLIEGKFYIAVLTENAPMCWILDFTQSTVSWMQVPILISMNRKEYHPIRSTAGAAIKNEIYMFGGESILTGQPTNIMYKLDIRTMNLCKVIVNGNYPTPRLMHSFDPVDSGHIILFGGHTSIHDDDDMWVYDSCKNTWRKYLAPPSSRLCLPKDWIPTSGIGPGRRCGAAIFIMRRKIIILGGSRKYNDTEKNEYMNIFCPVKKNWERVQID
ncbi:7191_t:CDS:2, partial [Racocetra fulgida]